MRDPLKKHRKKAGDDIIILNEYEPICEFRDLWKQLKKQEKDDKDKEKRYVEL